MTGYWLHPTNSAKAYPCKKNLHFENGHIFLHLLGVYIGALISFVCGQFSSESIAYGRFHSYSISVSLFNFACGGCMIMYTVYCLIHRERCTCCVEPIFKHYSYTCIRTFWTASSWTTLTPFCLSHSPPKNLSMEYSHLHAYFILDADSSSARFMIQYSR